MGATGCFLKNRLVVATSLTMVAFAHMSWYESQKTTPVLCLFVAWHLRLSFLDSRNQPNIQKSYFNSFSTSLFYRVFIKFHFEGTEMKISLSTFWVEILQPSFHWEYSTYMVSYHFLGVAMLSHGCWPVIFQSAPRATSPGPRRLILRLPLLFITFGSSHWCSPSSMVMVEFHSKLCLWQFSARSAWCWSAVPSLQSNVTVSTWMLTCLTRSGKTHLYAKISNPECFSRTPLTERFFFISLDRFVAKGQWAPWLSRLSRLCRLCCFLGKHNQFCLLPRVATYFHDCLWREEPWKVDRLRFDFGSGQEGQEGSVSGRASFLNLFFWINWCTVTC